MQIEHKWPGKSSQMNDTSGTQKIATHMIVDSINTAFWGIDIYKNVIIDGYHPKCVIPSVHLMSQHTYI